MAVPAVYREIPLSNGGVALIDADDYERVSKHTWHAHHQTGYVTSRITVAFKTKRNITLHRFVTNAQPGEIIDHKNRDRRDCRKDNLRRCTSTQNQANHGPSSANTTGYRGVTYYQARNRYRATVQAQPKHIMCGYFKTAEEAARAYNAVALRVWGEFAYLNPVD